MDRSDPARVSARAHRDPELVAAKLARLGEPHVAPLVELADRIAADRGAPGTVPYPDPTGAGIDARALFLLESPSPKAARSTGGSGMLSLDNDDATAATMHDAYAAADLSRTHTQHWNVVPWIAPGTSKSELLTEHAPAAAGYLEELIRLLRELRVVVTCGDLARAAWFRALADRLTLPLLPTLHINHTSARGMNARDARPRLAAVLTRVTGIVAP